MRRTMLAAAAFLSVAGAKAEEEHSDPVLWQVACTSPEATQAFSESLNDVSRVLGVSREKLVTEFAQFTVLGFNGSHAGMTCLWAPVV